MGEGKTRSISVKQWHCFPGIRAIGRVRNFHCRLCLCQVLVRFSTVILLIFVFTMQAPTPIIPFYVLFVRLKLTDSYLGLILAIAAGAIPLSIFIFRPFPLHSG